MISTNALQSNEDSPFSASLSSKARRLRIALMEPLNVTGAAWGSTKKVSGRVPPMGLIAIYSWLKHRGYDVVFFDSQALDVDASVLREQLLAGQFDVCGIPLFTPTVDLAYDTARLVKDTLPNCRIVFGGIHATTRPEMTLQQCAECDFVVRHEGELTIDALLTALGEGRQDWEAIDGLAFRREGEIVLNQPRAPIENLDILPVGSYADIDLTPFVPHSTQYVRLPNYPLMTQRGCPFRCTFCQGSAVHGPKPRQFSPERIVKELRILKNDKGARGFYFQDSTFTTHRQWTVELMKLMIQENLDLLWSCNTRTDRIDPELLDLMYKAGCRRLFLGIESGNQASLDIIRKGMTVENQTRAVKWVRQSGITHCANFMICLPGEDEQMVRNTIRYAKSLRSPMTFFWLPVPYPGTAMYDACLEQGEIRESAQWRDYLAVDYDNPVYINPNFGVEGMRYWYKRAYMEYYTSPRTWAAILGTMRTKDDLHRIFRMAKAGSALLSHGVSEFLLHQVVRARKKSPEPILP